MPTIILELDEDDCRAVEEVIAKKQNCPVEFRGYDGDEDARLPDGEGNLAGRYLAEACRDWLEYREIFRRRPPHTGG